MIGIGLAEAGYLPDWMIRLGIRWMLRDRLRGLEQPDPEAAQQELAAFIDELRQGPVALTPELPNEQHYEVAPEFFEAVLGRRLKYSCALWSEGVADLDAAEANLVLRRAQLQELLAGTTVEELAQAEQALQQAEARRDSAAVDVARHMLTAMVDGVFDSRLFEVGERPAPGQPVAVMLGGPQPYARIYVPERLRVHVRPGTEARVAVDGIDSTIAGRVRWVASEAAFTPYFALTERDRGRLTYLAKVDLDEQRERLPDGVPVEVELLVPDGAQ